MTYIIEPYYLFKKPQNFSLMILILDPLAIRARIVYVFHHDLISPVVAFSIQLRDAKIISSPFTPYCSSTGAISNTPALPIFLLRRRKYVFPIGLCRCWPDFPAHYPHFAIAGPNMPRDAFQPFPSGLSG